MSIFHFNQWVGGGMKWVIWLTKYNLHDQFEFYSLTINCFESLIWKWINEKKQLSYWLYAGDDLKLLKLKIYMRIDCFYFTAFILSFPFIHMSYMMIFNENPTKELSYSHSPCFKKEESTPIFYCQSTYQSTYVWSIFFPG